MVSPDTTSGALEAFNGDTKSAKTWLQRFERVALLSRWDDNAKLLAIEMKLSGSALAWHKATGAKCTTYDAWKTAFTAAFIRETDKTELYRAMISRVQQPKEKAVDYVRSKQQLCAELELADDHIKKEILCGLRDTSMAGIMRAKTHTSIDDLAFDLGDA